MRYLVLLIIVVPHLYCIIWADERWPYSHYPMYAPLRQETISFQAITGFHENGVVDLTKSQFWGVSWGSIRGALRSSLRRAKASDVSPDPVAAAILHEYERRRSLGLHQGPRIDRVRIESRQWNVDSRAALESLPFVTVLADSDYGQKASGVQ